MAHLFEPERRNEQTLIASGRILLFCFGIFCGLHILTKTAFTVNGHPGSEIERLIVFILTGPLFCAFGFVPVTRVKSIEVTSAGVVAYIIRSKNLFQWGKHVRLKIRAADIIKWTLTLDDSDDRDQLTLVFREQGGRRRNLSMAPPAGGLDPRQWTRVAGLMLQCPVSGIEGQ